MKEFRYKTGGRRLYNEDIDRLQQLALSATKIFEDCNTNFVISGCQVSITQNSENQSRVNISVSAGYVWIDGKIREVPNTNINNAPQSYIVAIKTNDIINDEMIRYADGSSGPAYYDYGVLVVSSAEEDLSEDVYIKYNQETERFPNIEDFITTYAVGKRSQEWINLKTNALTKDGGQLHDSASLKLTHGMDEDGDEVFASIAPHLIKMQNGDYTEVTEIDGNGIRTTGDIKASKLECDTLIIYSEETDDNGNRVVTQSDIKLSTLGELVHGVNNLDAKVTDAISKVITDNGVSVAIPDDTIVQIDDLETKVNNLMTDYEELTNKVARLQAQAEAYTRVVSLSSTQELQTPNDLEVGEATL